MMRLKDLLLEDEIKRWVDKLDEELATGEWVVRDPVIYRGRERDEKPVKRKETTDGREPRDTEPVVNNIVNFYHDYCYEQFPSRDEVRFGTTDKYWAMEFGTLHIIFPHKDAIVYHSKHDPVHEFGGANDGLNDFYRRLKNWYQDIDGDWPSRDVRDLAYHFKEMVESGEVEEDYLKENPCVRDMADKVNSIERNMDTVPEENWPASLVKFYTNINTYFQEMEMGYPEKERSSDEVVFKGKYLQVQKDVFEEHSERN